MKKNLLTLCALALFTPLFFACNQNCKKEYQDLSETEIIKEGKRLVTVMGCNDCHSPKKMTQFGPAPDENLLLSGHPESAVIADRDSLASLSKKWILFDFNGTVTLGPWGTSFAANLTPDDTGIGNWTLDQFTIAMREGRFKGMKNGRLLLPPMPSVGYKALKDDEIKAIFSYLKSIKPIQNRVPAPIPPQQ